jgi:hypothetical protein
MHLNQRPAARLRPLSAYLHANDCKYMFELLVPAPPEQLQQFSGDCERYGQEQRPALMIRAIRELQEAGVEPDVWKIEGLDRREDWARWLRLPVGMGVVKWAVSSLAGARTGHMS